MQSLRQLSACKNLLSACLRSAPGCLTTGPAAAAQDLTCQSLHSKLQHLVLAAAAPIRSFASDTDRPDRQPTTSADRRENSSAGTSTSQAQAGNSDYLEDWARLIDKNDTVGQAELLHRMFGENPEPVGPPLSELLNYNRRDEERAKRRMFELQKQDEIKQSR